MRSNRLTSHLKLRPKYIYSNQNETDDWDSVHKIEPSQPDFSSKVNLQFSPTRNHLLSKTTQNELASVLNKIKGFEDTTGTLNKHKLSYAHQNSNQNLYSKEVYIKFPHKNMARRVLMKV